MDLEDFFDVLRWHWILIVVITVVVVAGVLAYSFIQTPVYEAKSTCMVSAKLTGQNEYSAVQVIEQLMQTINKIAVSRPVLEKASKDMEGKASPDDLAKNVSSEVLTNTQIIQITARSDQPAMARNKANAVVNSLIAYFNQANMQGNSYTVVKIEPALTPKSPVSPRPIKNGILGLFLGLFLGVTCALIVDSMSRSSSPGTYENTETPKAPGV